ncbi:GumC family protein [Prevotella sp. oral taxon 317]|uniref:GumC family protein n=1 Tax=Prevotella sp. oral taxon 317 TaxID=652721 RepID=UPI0001C3F5E8|nr:polysaccharide biosynthesis tyrosine autokinase [Prevotella sp. oral taxon 317]EFC69490.1 chain length determinant protein [Prevotella sp. oral taxon 317 str. F0108]
MEENIKNNTLDNEQAPAGKSLFNFQTVYMTLILNWKWFVLSLIICLGLASIYLRYTIPIYQTYAKLLIKEENNSRGRNSLQYTTNLGMVSNSTGIDNEMEILKSSSIAIQAVKDLKLYTTYMSAGKVTNRLMYKTQPISVDIDPIHLDILTHPISLTITREGKKYHVEGTYYSTNPDAPGKAYAIDKSFTALPAAIGTQAGILTFIPNSTTPMKDGEKVLVRISPPKAVAIGYAAGLSIAQSSKSTSIAVLTINDQSPERAIDYLKQLAICYNRQANEDKNEVAVRTEEFINGRLEKINTELGSTESQLESYKKANKMVELQMSANQALSNSDQYDQKLAEANTQIALLNSINDYMNQPSNKYETLPANIGISDQSAVSLINKYNEIVLERNRLLRSASENSPTVTPLTSQLDDLSSSIRRAMAQAKRSMDIQRNAVASQYGKYNSMIQQTPEQEKTMKQIGRQLEVKAGLYLMLLQKREENSISLAATADKGKLIDDPTVVGKVAPRSSTIYAGALAAGLAIPSVVFFLLSFFRYKIEGHDDVARLTRLPIIADVAVASETAKTKADIVVHENQNNQMEEIFRSMRTNVQFMLKENEKVISFTSSISGEGKTFIAANLAVSFALLGKKVILVGLDIRKPRLAELFEIDDHRHGITNLLTKTVVTAADIQAQTLPSGVNDNLELLMAGPIPPNPAELLTRTSLDDIMDLLKRTYDYVIIDTAPVGLVTDTLQVGRVSNLTVYVCRADYTPKENFELINTLHVENKLPNICVVVNGIDLSKKKYGYYYGYGKYGRYAKYGYYGKHGKYGRYNNYGNYGNYSNSHYSNENDTSVKQ